MNTEANYNGQVFFKLGGLGEHLTDFENVGGISKILLSDLTDDRFTHP